MAAKWNVMVDMAGFNNLSTFATKDLQERKVGSTTDVKLTAFIKRLEQQSAHHILVGKNGQGEKRTAVGDIDSGSPQTLLDFEIESYAELEDQWPVSPLGEKVKGCGGVTVYWPFPVPGVEPEHGLSPYDKDLRFARKGWDEFLRSSMRSVRA